MEDVKAVAREFGDSLRSYDKQEVADLLAEFKDELPFFRKLETQALKRCEKTEMGSPERVRHDLVYSVRYRLALGVDNLKELLSVIKVLDRELSRLEKLEEKLALRDLKEAKRKGPQKASGKPAKARKASGKGKSGGKAPRRSQEALMALAKDPSQSLSERRRALQEHDVSEALKSRSTSSLISSEAKKLSHEEPKYKVGDFVRFASADGSHGQVTKVYPNSGNGYGPHYDVLWSYGLDAKGRPITSFAGGQYEHLLVSITEEEFKKVAENRAWDTNEA